MVEALNEPGLKPVLIGSCSEFSRAYLDKALAYPHVAYLGPLACAAPLLPSGCAAAGVFCGPSLRAQHAVHARELGAGGADGFGLHRFAAAHVDVVAVDFLLAASHPPNVAIVKHAAEIDRDVMRLGLAGLNASCEF